MAEFAKMPFYFCLKGDKKKVLNASQVAHQAKAYPSFRTMKRLGIFHHASQDQ